MYIVSWLAKLFWLHLHLYGRSISNLLFIFSGLKQLYKMEVLNNRNLKKVCGFILLIKTMSSILFLGIMWYILEEWELHIKIWIEETGYLGSLGNSRQKQDGLRGNQSHFTGEHGSCPRSTCFYNSNISSGCMQQISQVRISGTWPRGYNTWVHSQTQNKSQAAIHCALFWVSSFITSRPGERDLG